MTDMLQPAARFASPEKAAKDSTCGRVRTRCSKPGSPFTSITTTSYGTASLERRSSSVFPLEVLDLRLESGPAGRFLVTREQPCGQSIKESYRPLEAELSPASLNAGGSDSDGRGRRFAAEHTGEMKAFAHVLDNSAAPWCSSGSEGRARDLDVTAGPTVSRMCSRSAPAYRCDQFKFP
jgi:hypothetical protein